jgi:hypothetical protein
MTLIYCIFIISNVFVLEFTVNKMKTTKWIIAASQEPELQERKLKICIVPSLEHGIPKNGQGQKRLKGVNFLVLYRK